MATYFSINDGILSGSLAEVIGDVPHAGALGFMLGTTYSYPSTLATATTNPIYGVAFQLSAVSGSPTGTIDLILSANDGSAATTASFPISGLTPYTSNSNITPNYPVSWQLFAFNTPVTYTAGKSVRVGVKTSTPNKVSLMGASLSNLNRSYVTNRVLTATPTSSDIVHIVGSLTTSGLSSKIVDYNVASATLSNFYVHNGGVLNFNPNIDITLNLAGTFGMQITPGGTVNIGTSSSPVLSGKVHTINLNNCYINVNNGGSLNTYGAYKTPYALLASNTVPNFGIYPLTTNISNWLANTVQSNGADSIVVTPNISAFSSFEAFTYVYAKANDYSVQIGVTNPLYVHNASNYIPSIVNMTRNVRFVGTNTTYGYIRFLDGSNSSLNNTSFKGFRNTTYKGIQFCTDSTGSVSLSNCAFNGDGIASTPAFSFDSNKTPTSNVSIKGCSFFGYGTNTDPVTLNAVSANNFTFTNNIVLSSSQNGMFINALSSTNVDIKDNFLIGNAQNGLRVLNSYVLSGGIGGIGCINGNCGSVVAGTSNIGNFDGLAGHYNPREGVNILGTISQLSSTIFRNVTANNNLTSGLMLSGNSTNLLSPIKVTIHGLIANNNRKAGLEGYSISGYLSAIDIRDNEAGNALISIGNADTIFNNVTSYNTNSQYIANFGNKTSSTLALNADYPPFLTVDGSLNSNPVSTTTFLSALDTDFSFAGDFTIETWFKTTNSIIDTRARRIFGFGAGAANGLQLILGTADAVVTSTLSVLTDTALIIGTTEVADGQWHHAAISRVGGVMKLFVDGTQDGDDAITNTSFNAGDTLPLFIGRYAGAANGRFDGLISNFRILNRLGLYTETFNLPETPFDMIAGTALLLNGSDYTNKTYKHLPQSNIDILSGRNFSATLFANSNLKGNNTSAIKFNDTKFEQFSMDSTTLSSNIEDITCSTQIDLLQGSYQFNNCTFGSGITNSVIQGYQPEIFTENGFVVMKENGTSNKHYRLLRAGKISLDDTFAKSPNTISEKLEPTSSITKLRCGSKMITTNAGESYVVSCYIYKSSGYSGDAPRLILKHNSALGYDDVVLATSIGPDSTWELLTGNLPAALDQGVFEIYVDCAGESDSGSVNIDSWSFVKI